MSLQRATLAFVVALVGLLFLSEPGLAQPDDHGNDSSTATSVAVPSTTGGEIETGADVDFFSFFGLAGSLYVIETTLDTLEDSVLTIFDASSQQTARNDDFSGLASRVEHTVAETGLLYVQVSAFSESEVGTYTLLDQHDVFRHSADRLE